MKVAFAGTHGTGKTTLVNELKNIPQLKKYKFFSNFSRKISKEGYNLNNRCDLEGQLKFVDQRLVELKNNNFVSDRSSYDVLAYTLASENMTKKQKELIEMYHKTIYQYYDVIFYLPIEFAMEKDGVRLENEKYRKKIDKIIKKLLKKYPPNKIIMIDGDLQKRLNKVKGVLCI